MRHKEVWAILTVLLSIYAAFSTFQWMNANEKIENVKGHLITLSELPLREISEAGASLEYLLKTSNETFRERVAYYASSTRTLNYVSYTLYETTKERKFYFLSAAMANLEAYLTTAKNSKNAKEKIVMNLDLLKEIGKRLEGKRLNEISEKEAKEIFKLSSKLRY